MLKREPKKVVNEAKHKEHDVSCKLGTREDEKDLCQLGRMRGKAMISIDASCVRIREFVEG